MASGLHIRPQYKKTVQGMPHEVLARIRIDLDRRNAPCEGTVSNHHALLRIPDADAHFWSPRLTVQVEPAEDRPGSTHIRCMFGPSPTVWTLFIAIYAAVGFLGMVALIWGMAQRSLGMDAPILWGVPMAIVVGLSAWLTSGYGQHLGRAQMGTLKDFLDEVLDDSPNTG